MARKRDNCYHEERTFDKKIIETSNEVMEKEAEQNGEDMNTVKSFFTKKMVRGRSKESDSFKFIHRN